MIKLFFTGQPKNQVKQKMDGWLKPFLYSIYRMVLYYAYRFGERLTVVCKIFLTNFFSHNGSFRSLHCLNMMLTCLSSHIFPFLPPSRLFIRLFPGSQLVACGPAAAVCVATNRERGGETHHDRQITMLQHHSNWPGAHRESLLLSRLVFREVRAEEELGGGG